MLQELQQYPEISHFLLIIGETYRTLVPPFFGDAATLSQVLFPEVAIFTATTVSESSPTERALSTDCRFPADSNPGIGNQITRSSR
jgi:hypothetical protein